MKILSRAKNVSSTTKFTLIATVLVCILKNVCLYMGLNVKKQKRYIFYIALSIMKINMIIFNIKLILMKFMFINAISIQ